MERPISKDFEYSTGELKDPGEYIDVLEEYINYLETKDKFTGYYDVDNQPIFVGDKLRNEFNYDIIVKKDDDLGYYGKLICDDQHSCKNIPYSLNKGKGYRKIIE